MNDEKIKSLTETETGRREWGRQRDGDRKGGDVDREGEREAKFVRAAALCYIRYVINLLCHNVEEWGA